MELVSSQVERQPCQGGQLLAIGTTQDGVTTEGMGREVGECVYAQGIKSLTRVFFPSF